MVVSAFINKIKRYRNQEMICSSMLFDSIEFEVNCKRKTKLFQLMKRIDLSLNMDDFAQVLEQPAGQADLGLTVVVPPPSSVRFSGLLVTHEFRVKSGMSTVLEPLATDLSLRGTIELHNAASYTSWSSGNPFLRQSISLQSIMKSIPPCPPTTLAISPICFTIAGEYFS